MSVLNDPVADVSSSNGVLYYILKSAPRRIMSYNPSTQASVQYAETDEPLQAVLVNVAGMMVIFQ